LDSLTQIILGGAVGEAVLGKKVGNKAVLWGAVGGTIPDLDVIPGKFMDTVSALDIHRGFSHSFVFAIIVAPILGYLLHWLYRKKGEADWWGWTLMMFMAIFTHPLLDIFTTWGTQFFWPLDWRIALQSIFVIDPLYTVPFLICLLAVLMLKRTSKKRRKWNRLGLIISSSYLLLTLFLKLYVNSKFTAQLAENNISYVNFSSRPTPLNTVLWTFNVEREDAFDIGYYGLFDQKDSLQLRSFPKNDHLLNPYRNNPQVERLVFLTKGQYIIEEIESGIYMHDLRFGLIDGLSEDSRDFAFTYYIRQEEGEVVITEKEKTFKGTDQALHNLWDRMWNG